MKSGKLLDSPRRKIAFTPKFEPGDSSPKRKSTSTSKLKRQMQGLIMMGKLRLPE